MGRSLTSELEGALARGAGWRGPVRRVHAASLFDGRQPVRDRAVRRRVSRATRTMSWPRSRSPAGSVCRCCRAARERASPARPSDAPSCSTCRATCIGSSVSMPRRMTARVQPGLIQDELNKAAGAAPPDVRARHVDIEPRHARRHDRQQLVRRALGALRDDDRSRRVARRRAVRREPSEVRCRSTRPSSRVAARAIRWTRGCIATCRVSSREHETRSVATFRRSGASPAAIVSSAWCPSAARSISRISSSGPRERWRSSSRQALGSCRSRRRSSAWPATSRPSPRRSTPPRMRASATRR